MYPFLPSIRKLHCFVCIGKMNLHKVGQAFGTFAVDQPCSCQIHLGPCSLRQAAGASDGLGSSHLAASPKHFYRYFDILA